ncbi:MAG: extracellular solute-binding protein [Lachnospiraceae bacterium]|nr:extracellular solute-binding protein [Lachnospiraceae bacterium]
MKKVRRTAAYICCLLAAAGILGGCTGSDENRVSEDSQEIVIPMTLTVDPTTGNKNEQTVVEAFNKEYKGKYYLDVEWVMETEEEYRQNLKRMNVTDHLPAILTDLRMLPSYYQMMIEDGRIEDLSEEINKDQEWKDMIEPVVMEGCSEPDGSIYLAPLSTAAFSCSGVFWNQELFEEAGIEKFPETWEEFWECCEALKQHGITPLALHTEGTAWAPMLLATACAADSEEGAAFMKELYPSTYENESGKEIAAALKKLFAYTTEDAIHTDFDVAYINFVQGKAAMIPNGYWMIDQIPEDVVNHVRFSAFPGNKLISSPETFGWSVVSDYSREVKEGAIEFLKFRTKLNREEREELFAEGGKSSLQVVQDYIQAYRQNPQIVPNYQVKWNSILQEETLGEILPLLVQDKISVDEFVRLEDESIQQFNAER